MWSCSCTSLYLLLKPTRRANIAVTYRQTHVRTHNADRLLMCTKAFFIPACAQKWAGELFQSACARIDSQKWQTETVVLGTFCCSQLVCTCQMLENKRRDLVILLLWTFGLSSRGSESLGIKNGVINGALIRVYCRSQRSSCYPSMKRHILVKNEELW